VGRVSRAGLAFLAARLCCRVVHHTKGRVQCIFGRYCRAPSACRPIPSESGPNAGGRDGRADGGGFNV